MANKNKVDIQKIISPYKRNNYNRLLLAEQRKFASFPDLLDGQKK